VSVPIKTAAATAGLTLAFTAAPATAFTDTQYQAREHTPTTAQQADRIPRNLPGPQDRQESRALRLALAQQEVRHRRAELIAGWKARASRAVRFAYNQRGKPYLFGGTGKGGFDCSGLVQQSWLHAGIQLARIASTQFHTIHTHISPYHLRPGDLVFFRGLAHVGMYVGHDRFIHSPHTGDHVRVTPFDHYYRNAFVGATRPAWHPLPHIPTNLHPQMGLDR
jgi:cell wall-associated NlpC family hydrolase